MSLQEFQKEFYDSRLEEWINKYIKFKEMLHLIKLIKRDIKTHTGKIYDNSSNRYSTLSDELSCDTEKLERRSLDLGILNDTEGIFDNNEKIFNSPIMYDIDKTYKEIMNLQFEDDIKIFLYFLQIEVHNVYVFYLSIEKEIYTRTNLYLNQKYNNSEFNGENQVLNQLKELIEIAYLTYSFYLYIDLNLEAVKQILEYFDTIFLKFNNGISIKKLFYSKNILNKESDLKYILGFKIINECSILLENYCYEAKNNFPRNKKIKAQCKELKEVLSYIIEKNTIRVDDNLYDIYQRAGEENTILKKKDTLDFDIQNSLFVDSSQNELLNEEFEYDRHIKIQITNKNKINLIFIYIHIFLYSFFGIIPYIVFFILCKKDEGFKQNEQEKIKHYEIGIALSSTHLGSLLSKYILSNLEKFKFSFIFFGICFFISFSLILMSFVFILEDLNEEALLIDRYILFSIFNILSRFIYGLSGGRVITRKYINLFLPESQIRFYSILYMFIVNCGYIFGIVFLFIFLGINIDFYIFHFYINYVSLPFIIGFFLTLIYLILIILYFTEPNEDKGRMLSHQIKTNENQVNMTNIKKENKKENILKNKNDNKDNLSNNNNNSNNNSKNSNKEEEINEEIPINKISSLVTGQKLIYLDEIYDIDEEECKSMNAKSVEHMSLFQNKEEEKISKKSNKKNNNNKSKPLNNLTNSKGNETLNSKYSSTVSEELKEKLLTAEEIKGLNSIEKAIITLNTQNNFDDTNLFPKELDRIKISQSNNNKQFFKTIIVFILLLNTSNMINEFLLLLIQINIQINNNIIFNNEFENQDLKKLLFFVLFITLITFVFSMIFTIFSIQKINRKILLFLNIFLIFNISLILSTLIGKVEYFDKFAFINVLMIFATNDLINGLSSLFSDKIVPSFIRICNFNARFLISYISTLGRLLGGITFWIMMYFIENNDNNQKIYLIIFIIIYDLLSFICLICLGISYNSLKMRALSKLRAIKI